MGGTMRWAELRMYRFWASSFPFSRAREYRLLRRLAISLPFHISSVNKFFWSEYQDIDFYIIKNK